MSKYSELCEKMDHVGGYMSDVIGKCQRELRRGESGRSRIDLFLAESETYGAFLRGDNLAARFDNSRATSGFLVWVDEHDWKTKTLPMPVTVDWVSGIVRQRTDHAYGLISDVVRCLKQRDAEGNFIPLTSPL